MSERKCKGSNAKGAPCGAAPLSGLDWCRAHDPNASDETRFGSSAQAAIAGSAPKPRRHTLTEQYNAILADRAQEIFAKGYELLHASKTIVTGEGDEALAEQAPDWPVQMRAYQDFLDRGLGKPTQAVEMSGPDGGPIQHAGADLSKLTDEQIAALEAIHADDPE